MMIWEIIGEAAEGETLYGLKSDDGLIRLTAIKGHPELDAYLTWVEAGNDPDEFWNEGEI